MTEAVQVDSTAKPPRALFWPVTVVTLLVTQTTMWLVMLYIASTDPSFAVEPDYYQKGQQWNMTRAQLVANQELGWRLNLSIKRPSGTFGMRALTMTLINRDGQMLDGATVMVEAFAHSRANDRLQLELKPLGNGRYATEARLQRTGLWEFRFTVQRGPDTFTAVKTQDVTTPKG